MGTAKIYPGLFASYQKTGSDWIRRLEPEDLKAFIELGMRSWDYGKLGGKARAKSAQRDEKGRFTKNGVLRG